jgi:glycerol-3-phosphate dehydrogenase (NAD(P)+)
LSRNRCFGERLGAGASLQSLLDERVSVVEGYYAVRSAMQMIEKASLDAPIHQEVHAMLYEGKPAAEAMRNLLAREARQESD